MSPRDKDSVLTSPDIEHEYDSTPPPPLEPSDGRTLDFVADQITPPTRRSPPLPYSLSVILESESTTADQSPAGTLAPEAIAMRTAAAGDDTAAAAAVLSHRAAKHSLFGIDMPFDMISAGFAALVATGGVIGYAKAGSIPSLAAGLTFGGILGVGAYLTSVNPNNYYLTAGTSLVLGSVMGYRFYNSGKFMPAGLMCALSVGMLIRYSVQAIGQAKAHRAD